MDKNSNYVRISERSELNANGVVMNLKTKHNHTSIPIISRIYRSDCGRVETQQEVNISFDVKIDLVLKCCGIC